jgi:hypothetical protein
MNQVVLAKFSSVQFSSVLQEILENLELNFRLGREMLELEPEPGGSGSGVFSSGSRGGLNRKLNFVIGIKN